MRQLQLYDRCAYRFSDRDLARATGATDRETDHGLLIEKRRSPRLRRAIGHGRDRGESDRAAFGQRDRIIGELRGVAHHGDSAYRLLRTTGLGAAARPLELQPRQLLRHGTRRHAERLQRLGTQIHPDLALHTTGTGHRTDSGQPIYRLGDSVVDEPGQLVQGRLLRGDGVADQRAADQNRALHDRLVDVRRQFTTGAHHRIAYFIERGVDIASELELDAGDRRPLGDRGVDLFDIGDARHGILDLARDIGLEDGGRGARQTYGHLDRGQRDVGQFGDREFVQAPKTRGREQHECEHRGQRMLDTPA